MYMAGTGASFSATAQLHAFGPLRRARYEAQLRSNELDAVMNSLGMGLTPVTIASCTSHVGPKKCMS